MKFSNHTITYSVGAKGFKTSITVLSNNPANAMTKAKQEIKDAYGTEIFNEVVFN